MKFGTLDSAIKRCEEHLDKTATRNTEIENYFVQYLLIRICAEYENRVKALFHRRCSRTADAQLKSFAQQTAVYICKRFSIRDITSMLGKFGSDYKHNFHSQVMSGVAHLAWDNIYTNRRAVAHEAGTQMSFGDLKTAYSDSLRVLDALVNALSLNATEIHDFK
jgi:hypothetical protein